MGTVTNTRGSQGFDAEEEARDEAGKPEGRGDAEDDANDGKAHAVPHDERTDAGAVGSESHADADLLGETRQTE
jgi:hypothetical protein